MSSKDRRNGETLNSFGDNLTELERLRQELKGMLVPGPGVRTGTCLPGTFHIQSVQAS